MSVKVVATHNFVPVEVGDLGFQKGDILTVIEKVLNSILSVDIIEIQSRMTAGGKQNLMACAAIYLALMFKNSLQIKRVILWNYIVNYF
jgi:hypothetical protein